MGFCLSIFLLSSHRSGFCECLLSSHRSWFCDCLLSSHQSRFCCFVIWKRKGLCRFFFFFFVWWILVATMKVDAGIAVAEVAVTVAIGFCGDCFYIILKYYIYYFK